MKKNRQPQGCRFFGETFDQGAGLAVWVVMIFIISFVIGYVVLN